MDNQAAIFAGLLGTLLGPLIAGSAIVVPAGQPWRMIPAVTRSLPWQRPSIVSVLSGLIAGLVGGSVGLTWELPGYLWLVLAGVALAIIDLDCHRLPNRLVFPTYVIGLCWLAIVAVVQHDLARYGRAVSCLALVYAIFYLAHWISPGSLGFGDVKLAGVLGLYLGWLSWSHVLSGIALAFLVSGIAILPMLAVGRMRLNSTVPFGPALLLGAVLSVVMGNGAFGAI